MTLLIRNEEFEDIPAISVIVSEAFSDQKIVDLVENLRKSKALTLSLVAIKNGELIGYIAFSPVTISTDTSSICAVGLGPLAVKPGVQSSGIGSALVTKGLEILQNNGWDTVTVLGDPKYYSRFGFKPASKHGVIWDRKDAGPAFQVLEIMPGGFRKTQGIVSYHPAFNLC